MDPRVQFILDCSALSGQLVFSCKRVRKVSLTNIDQLYQYYYYTELRSRMLLQGVIRSTKELFKKTYTSSVIAVQEVNDDSIF